MLIPGNESIIQLVAGKLFDPLTCQLLDNRVITVSKDSGLILSVQPLDTNALDFYDPKVVDLRDLTVLPGFVDVHVHFFLHPYSETSWEDQLTKETIVERTIRATIHAKKTLMAGFTSVRDLGTEGAGDADVALRKCLSGINPLIPGPRYFCASRAIVPTGSYGPKSSIHVNTEGIDGVTGAEVADGTVECIKAVRRQIGAGADWIKLYADYRFRSRVADVSGPSGSSSMPIFSEDELHTIIKTAHDHGVKVAAHATNRRTIAKLVKLGIDSIEHGDRLHPIKPCHGDSGSVWESTIWVPTLAASYTLGSSDGRWEQTKYSFQTELAKGCSRMACGGDTGVFTHGDNALEMKLMVRLGADWRMVLKWATLGGWECIRSMRWEGMEGRDRVVGLKELREDPRVVGDNEVPFGVIRRGFAADIIATAGNLEKDFDDAVSANRIMFVMKGGRVYKRDGNEF